MEKKQLSFLIFIGFLGIQVFTHSFDLSTPSSDITGYDSEIDRLTSFSLEDTTQTQKSSSPTTPLHMMIAKSIQKEPQKETAQQYFRYNILRRTYGTLNKRSYGNMNPTQKEHVEYEFQIHISRINNKITSIANKIEEEKTSFIGIKAPLVDTTSQLEKELARHQKELGKIHILYQRITGNQFFLPEKKVKKRSITRTSPVEKFLKSTYIPIQPVNPQEFNKLRAKYGTLANLIYQKLNSQKRKEILSDFRLSSYKLLERSNTLSENLAKEMDKKRKHDLCNELQMAENELREICRYFSQITGQTLCIKDNHFQALDA